MNEEEIKQIKGEMAKGLWQAFEYASPRETWFMANWVMTFFDLQGYEIRKKGE